VNLSFGKCEQLNTSQSYYLPTFIAAIFCSYSLLPLILPYIKTKQQTFNFYVKYNNAVTIIVRNHLISTPISRCLCSRTPLAPFPRIQLGHNTEQTLAASSLCFCRLCYAEDCKSAGFEVIHGHDTFSKSKQKVESSGMSAMCIDVSEQPAALFFRKELCYPLRIKWRQHITPHQTARRHIPGDRNLNVIQSYHIQNKNFQNRNRNFETELKVNFG
jgi:hypothetical protein